MRRTSSRRISAAAAALVALALAIALARLAAPSSFLAATAPLMRGGDAAAAALSGLTSGFASAQKLASENAALTSENTTLAEENAALSAKLADLAALANLVAPEPAPGIAAGVVARPPESAYDTLVVGAGSASGVAAGDAAYAAGGVPLGAVSAVSSGYARVTLLSASGVRTLAWLGPARLPITLVGQGGGAFSAEAPRSASTTPGEEVYVAGPGSLPVGAVARAGGDPSAPFLTLYIRADVNPAQVPMVLIRPGAPAWSSVAATSSPGGGAGAAQ
jgi:cell shape-determining protein MreC